MWILDCEKVFTRMEPEKQQQPQQTTSFSYERAVLPPLDLNMFPYQVRDPEGSPRKDGDEVPSDLNPVLIPINNEKADTVSNKEVPFTASVVHTEKTTSLQTANDSGDLKSFSYFVDPSTFQFQVQKPEELNSADRTLLGVDSAECTLSSSKDSDGVHLEHGVVNSQELDVLNGQLPQHIPSYETLKEQLSLTKDRKMRSVVPTAMLCAYVKTESDENSVNESNSCSYQQFDSDKESLSEVVEGSAVFPCDVVKTELDVHKESSTHELQNMRTDVFSYQTGSGLEKGDCQLIDPMHSSGLYSYQNKACPNSDNLPVLERNIIPFKKVKVELATNIQEPQEQHGLLYQEGKTEPCSGEEDPQIMQHLQHTILPFEAVKTELRPAGNEMLTLVQAADSVVFANQSVCAISQVSARYEDQQFTTDDRSSCPETGSEEKRVSESPQVHKWNAESMQQAVAAVRSGQMSSTRAAKHFNLPRTTLRRHLQPGGVANSKMEGREPQCQKWNADVMEEAVAVVLSGQMSSTKAAKYYNLPRTTLRRYVRTGGVSRPLRREQIQPDEFLCTECGRSFTKRWYLTSHLRTHSGEKLYNCEVCGKGLSHRDSLIMHLKTHSGERPFVCNECGRRFPKKDHLNMHMRTHSRDRPYGCDFCGKRFTDPFRLVGHSRTHTGEKPYRCQLCGHRFLQRVHLSKHLLAHSGERPYRCDVCGRCFSQGYNLRVHFRVHTGEKPYSCSVCSKPFYRRVQLTRHIRTHTGEKPYSCKICGRSFAQYSTLTVHRRRHNKESKPSKRKVVTSDTMETDVKKEILNM